MRDGVLAQYDCGCEICETYINHYDIYLQRCSTCESAQDLLIACEAAIAALDASADYVSSSVYAQMWAFCNGYDDSPDIRAIVAKAKGE